MEACRDRGLEQCLLSIFLNVLHVRVIMRETRYNADYLWNAEYVCMLRERETVICLRIKVKICS